MIRNLKTLGLALVAVFAMSSLAASAASATNDDFVADEAPVTLTGKQHPAGVNNKFILAGQAVECTTATVAAHVTSKTVSEITTTPPVYENCTYGGQVATVNMTGCHYLLKGNTDANGHAEAHLKCQGFPVKLTLNAIKCQITVAEQQATEGYTITTTGAGSTKELTLHITAKVNVTSHPDPSEGITCASLTNGSGTLEGTFTVTGEDPVTGTHIGITDEETKP